MDYSLGEPADKLRSKLRQMVDEHLPSDWMSPFTGKERDFELSQQFNRLLASDGLLTMAWPREYGGLEATFEDQAVVREEMWAHYEPRGSQYMGLNWAGPAIMAFGTDEQKDQWLPKIAQGDLTWCQGFSEPEAGSDLASLRTQAKPREHGGWVVNGQKIWTSYADSAQICMLAARTGPLSSRHRGVSMFLMPMDRAGIEVRMIDSMMGPSHINEVFLTDVWLEQSDLLGEVDRGWDIVRHILAHERVGIARYARADRLLNLERDALATTWEELPVAARARFARALVHVRVARLLACRVLQDQSRNVVVDGHAAIARLTVTLLDQEVAEVLMELAGAAGLDGKTSPHAVAGGMIEDYWRYARASTVASGTAEVLRMVLARELFGTTHG